MLLSASNSLSWVYIYLLFIFVRYIYTITYIFISVYLYLFFSWNVLFMVLPSQVGDFHSGEANGMSTSRKKGQSSEPNRGKLW